ncbi:hypothetical protein [Marinomonas spartinae]|uniref:hypothetical protein n=1 Tax=Marinomonas spartinae TaxID=1792290 RepID=UPI0011118B63|nr:hypothetical protein [Marinomonas spartinae]
MKIPPPIVGVVLYMALVGCACATVFGVAVWREPSTKEWVLLAVISIMSVAAQLLLVKALEYAPASVLLLLRKAIPTAFKATVREVAEFCLTFI